MLQIVTGMYFRPNVPQHSTVHRAVLYTNRALLRADTVKLPVGELAPSTSLTPISTVTVTVTETRETLLPDGSDDILIATDGHELIDELADVLSFSLNATFSRDHDLVRRLVPPQRQGARYEGAAKLLRGTVDPGSLINEDDWAQARAFIDALLALKRPHYEAAMRAIQRVVRAWQKVGDDPTIAYVDLVAALESLSATDQEAPLGDWEKVEQPMRAALAPLLSKLEPALASELCQAVANGSMAGAKARFLGFVCGSVTPAFFREDATEAIRPIRGADLKKALSVAYDVRSRNVHALRKLPPGVWAFGDRADTVSLPETGTILTVEGLSRVARHVTREYVYAAPREVEADFDWRAAVPGQIKMRLAPEYWISQAAGLTPATAVDYFAAFISHVICIISGEREGFVSIEDLLTAIEAQVGGLADSPAKSSMVAIYAIWHGLTVPSLHRPTAAKFLEKHGPILDQASIPAFAACMLTRGLPQLPADEWKAFAERRRTERLSKSHDQIPASIDAALQIVAAEALAGEGRTAESLDAAAWAMEELPGNKALLSWEASLHKGGTANLDIWSLVLRKSETESATETSASKAQIDEDDGRTDERLTEEDGATSSNVPPPSPPNVSADAAE